MTALDTKRGLDDAFTDGFTRGDLEACIVDTLPDAGPAWEPPLPLDDPTGPAFPINALPDSSETPLRSLVIATATQTQAPPDIAAWCTLAVIGAALRGRLDVQVRKDWREPAHIQSLQVLISGGGKGPTYKVLTRPLYRWDDKERALWEERHRAWEQERRLRDLNEQKARNQAKAKTATSDDEKRWQSYLKALMTWDDEEPMLRRIVASNTTAEALEKRIYEQGGAMAAISPEGGFLANITGAYSDTPKLGVLLHGYTGEPFENDRKTDNEQWRVKRSCVAVALAIQPYVLAAMGQVPGFQNLGVAARFLVTCPAPITWPDLNPPDIPEHLLSWWNRRIVAIADGTAGLAAEPEPMSLSPGALEVFNAEREWWRQATAQGAFADMLEWGRKYPGQVLRIAGLLHILQEVEPHEVAIPADAMARAVVIMRNAIAHARIGHALMHGMGEQSRERDVLDVVLQLDADADGDITSAMVYDRLRGRHAFQKAEAVIAALRSLEERRYIILSRRDGPGPRTYAVMLNPLHSAAKMRSFGDSNEPGVGPTLFTGHHTTISQFRRPSGQPETNDVVLRLTGTDGPRPGEIEI